MAGNDTRRLKVVVDSEVSDVDKDLGKVNKKLDETGKTAARAGDKLSNTGKKAKELGEKLTDTGTKATVAGAKLSKAFTDKSVQNQIKHVENLTKKLEAMKNHVKVQVEVDVDDKKLDAKVSKLGKAKAGFKKLGSQIGDAIGEGATKGLEAISKNPALTAGILAAATVLTPILGAAAAAGMVGGAAGIGIIGGIKLASNHPAVKAAAKSLGDFVGERLKDAAAPFVPELVKVLGKARKLFTSVEFDIRGIFQSASKYIDPLFEGVSGFLKALLPGLRQAVDAAKPLIEGFKEILPRIGKSLGDAFKKVSTVAPEIKGFVVFLGEGISTAVDFTASFVTFLAKAFGYLVRVANISFTIADSVAGWVPFLGDKIGENREKLKEFTAAMDGAGKSSMSTGDSVNALKVKVAAEGEAAKTAAQKNKELWQSTLDLKNQALAAINSEIAFKQAIDNAAVAVKENGKTINTNTTKGRENKSMLTALAAATNTLSNDILAETGSQAKATAAAEKGRKKFIELAEKMGVSKTRAKELADKLIAVGKTDPNVKISVSGYDSAVGKLAGLSTYQKALKSGIDPKVARDKYFNDYRSAMGKMATGGLVQGPGTGKSDSIVARLSKGEYVMQADAVKAYGKPFMESINRQGYKTGGMVWPFPTTASQTRIPSRAEAASAVAPSFGNWPKSPSAQRGDSGVWRSILALVKGSGIKYSFGNAYRPGDPKWHGSGRAIDFMGYNQDRLAKFFLSRQSSVLEMIHRSSSRDYAYTRGKNKGSFNQGLMNAHKNHLHIAMDGVSQVEPGAFLGYNATGKRETLVNSDLLHPVVINGPVTIVANDTKQFRDELQKLARRNGGQSGLPAR